MNVDERKLCVEWKQKLHTVSKHCEKQGRTFIRKERIYKLTFKACEAVMENDYKNTVGDIDGSLESHKDSNEMTMEPGVWSGAYMDELRGIWWMMEKNRPDDEKGYRGWWQDYDGWWVHTEDDEENMRLCDYEKHTEKDE